METCTEACIRMRHSKVRALRNSEACTRVGLHRCHLFSRKHANSLARKWTKLGGRQGSHCRRTQVASTRTGQVGERQRRQLAHTLHRPLGTVIRGGVKGAQLQPSHQRTVNHVGLGHEINQAIVLERLHYSRIEFASARTGNTCNTKPRPTKDNVP